MSWDQTQYDIIKRALRITGRLGQGETMSAEMEVEASDALNALMKELQSELITLFKFSDETQTLTASSEVDGTDAKNYRCIVGHTSGATSRPITGADWSSFWKQEGSSGIPWVITTAYTTIAEFSLGAETLDIVNAFARQDGNDHDIKLISLDEYKNIVDKYSESNLPREMYVEKGLIPKAYLYQMPNDTDVVIHYTRQKVIDDLEVASNNPDAPKRMYDMLTFGLAFSLSFEYGLPISDKNYLESQFEKKKLRFKRDDRQDVSEPFIEPAF